MAIVTPNMIVTAFDLLDTVDQRSFQPGVSPDGLKKAREACADVLITADNSLAQARKILKYAHLLHRIKGYRYRVYTLKRAMNWIATELWAQKYEGNLQPATTATTIVDRFVNSIYRGVPGTYGWRITQSLTTKPTTLISIGPGFSCEHLASYTYRVSSSPYLVTKYHELLEPSGSKEEGWAHD